MEIRQERKVNVREKNGELVKAEARETREAGQVGELICRRREIETPKKMTSMKRSHKEGGQSNRM